MKSKSREHEQLIAFVASLMKGARTVRGWSMRELAERIRISAATVCRLEGGLLPDAITFLRVIDWLQKESSNDALARTRAEGE